MEQDKKRLLRETKRQIKKDGNRSRRRYLKKQLEDNPESAHLDDYDYTFDTSTHLNGKDNDSTRIKDKDVRNNADEEREMDISG